MIHRPSAFPRASYRTESVLSRPVRTKGATERLRSVSGGGLLGSHHVEADFGCSYFINFFATVVLPIR